ncbi:ribbon-helix-helix protein, CopG family [Pyxidicoccus parkwayensis]|uniref:Ribbon-helix-helix protein, CopG family n=1 Tax=Pyxidicoccus parkwayensis TaxID=2813578 RepID=A0ABX7NQM5_9BACT|nr:ribbon-helix-helix protein, CopG family [Pyxidicoccus parkwaysis]QSQ19822.1 ribbon-helix-helix protein, CopG family [Pyxidicoccus parkwaysis]
MKRFNLELGDKTLQAIEELQDKTGRNSKADVIRDALALYEYLVRQASEQQKSLFLGSTQDDAVPLLVTSIEEAKRRTGDAKA